MNIFYYGGEPISVATEEIKHRRHFQFGGARRKPKSLVWTVSKNVSRRAGMGGGEAMGELARLAHKSSIAPVEMRL